jgi:hypothetical protein
LGSIDDGDLEKQGDGGEEDGAGPEGKPNEKPKPGGKEGTETGTGEKEGKKPDSNQVGKAGPKETAPGGKSQEDKGGKPAEGADSNQVPNDLEARPGEGRRWGSLGAGAGDASDGNSVSIKFILPDSVPMDFGPGTGAGNSSSYVGEKIDDGVVSRDVKIPPAYRKSVSRYYERIASPKEIESR